jgi:hypothetical protein
MHKAVGTNLVLKLLLVTLHGTVPLCKSKLFINISWPISVLTSVLGHLRHIDAKNGVKNYQEPTTFRANAIRKYLNFPHTFFL